jgi:hypothetical protein
MAIDGGLQIDLAHAFQHADEEGIDRDQRAGARRLDMALAELRAEAFELTDLFGAERDLARSAFFLQPQQALVLGQQTVALPHAAHAAGGDLGAFEAQFLFDPRSAPWQGCAKA